MLLFIDTCLLNNSMTFTFVAEYKFKSNFKSNKMKKLFIVAALFAVLSVNASYAVTSVSPQTETTVVADDQFKIIEIDQLPQPVKDAITKNYEGKNIKSAAVKEGDETKTYKVCLSDAEGTTLEVLFTDNGETVTME